MSFLFILPKPGSAGARPDIAELGARLCPYLDEIRARPVCGGTLYVSILGDLSGDTFCVLPRGTRKNPQTAWLEIAREPSGVRFETDPLGTFPLWAYEDDTQFVLTSEVKSLRALSIRAVMRRSLGPKRRPPNFSPFENVRRINPGAVLHVTANAICTEEERVPLDFAPNRKVQDASELEEALVASSRAIGSGDLGTFLSGGIDSSFATALMHRLEPDLRTFTLGTPYGDEYTDASALASALAVPNARVFANSDDAVAHFDRVVFCNETCDGLTAETLAQLRVLGQAAAGSVRRIVTGYGADLLFGSMLRHNGYLQVTGADDLRSLIERTAWTGEYSPFYAWSLGIEVHHLFWDPEVMNAAFRTPADSHYDGKREKVMLRELATRRGYLSYTFANRRKQALTDGSQFNRLLSLALGLPSPTSYDEKNERCIVQLRSLVEI